MYIQLIRNKPQGNSITGRLVIDGRWFCNTLERVGYQIPALCYHIAVTHSPKFKRLLPIVQNVPRTFPQGCQAQSGSPRSSWVRGESGGTCRLMTQCVSHRDHVAERVGIRFHRGSKPEHSTGCILVVADNINDNTDNLRGNQLPAAPKENIPCRSRDIDSSGTLSKLSSNNNSSLSSNKKNIGSRSAADIETQLTQLLFQTQESHEEIILEVFDFRPGTEYGYNHPCERELQQHEIDARRAEQRYYELHPEECKG